MCTLLLNILEQNKNEIRFFFKILFCQISKCQLSLKVSENWSYVAFVLDRLLLILFSTTLLIGTILILSSSSTATREWGEPLTTMRPTKPLSGDTFEFELRGIEQQIDNEIII